MESKNLVRKRRLATILAIVSAEASDLTGLGSGGHIVSLLNHLGNGTPVLISLTNVLAAVRAHGDARDSLSGVHGVGWLVG